MMEKMRRGRNLVLTSRQLTLDNFREVFKDGSIMGSIWNQYCENCYRYILKPYGDNPCGLCTQAEGSAGQNRPYDADYIHHAI